MMHVMRAIWVWFLNTYTAREGRVATTRCFTVPSCSIVGIFAKCRRESHFYSFVLLFFFFFTVLNVSSGIGLPEHDALCPGSRRCDG